jgi:hypothetical protein
MVNSIIKRLFQPVQYVLLHALIMSRGMSLWLFLIPYHASLLEVSGMKVKSKIAFKLFHLDPVFEEQEWASVLLLRNTT